MKDVNLAEPTSFLDHVYLGCTQRACSQNEDISEQYKEMFDSRVSAGATEKNYQDGTNNTQKKGSIWSYDMKGHAKKCVERYCESVNKKAEQLYKVSTRCLDDHHIKKEELE